MTATQENALKTQPASAAALPPIASDALARRDDHALTEFKFRMGIEPANLAELFQLAEVFHASGLFGVRSPEDCVVRILTGRALGWTAATSMRKVYVIDGKPGIEADAILAECRKNPACEYFRIVKQSATECTWVAKRRGDPEVTESWNLEMARSALLLDRGKDEESKKKSNWNRYPMKMMNARCITGLAKICFPESAAGISSIEELDDERTITVDQQTGAVTGTPVTKPSRDWAREVDALKLEIAAANTEPEKKALRAKLDEARKDMPEYHFRAVGEAYNAKFSKKSAEKPVAEKADRQPGEEG